jgi:hypothetical protein
MRNKGEKDENAKKNTTARNDRGKKDGERRDRDQFLDNIL